MDQASARDVLLARALEQVDRSHMLVTEGERREAQLQAKAAWASHADGRDPAQAAEQYVVHRARALIACAAHRQPRLASLREESRWHRALGLGLPLLAFIFGLAAERVTDPHRVDLVSMPLLAIVGWNLLVYATMLVFALWPGAGRSHGLHGLGRWMAEPWTRRRRESATMAALASSFSALWLRASAHLQTARWQRSLHASAALLALGALLSLLLRGLTVEYRAGWESTFLDAPQVHAILRMLTFPLAWLVDLPHFTVEEVAALRFGAAPASGSGARWALIYAVWLLLVAVLPRCALAAHAAWKVRRWSRHFPLDLNESWYQRLTAALDAQPPLLLVVPYSFALDSQRQRGLQAHAAAQLGDAAIVQLAPAVGYGEDLTPAAIQALPAGAKLVVALFSLSATPEAENHGAFVDTLATAFKGRLRLLVDESAFLQRFDAQAKGETRVRERRQTWSRFAEQHRLPVAFVELGSPQSHAG